jgi:hypothetical protein
VSRLLHPASYGEDELTRAGAFCVYRDPAELRSSLDEPGIEA